ncbi:MAG: peptide ABC transporter substrate-binding protein [Pseudonocardiaceae bacterium]|nr:peptide ABC transporter substrate-binding protein [Pseudonocardiaceae bacterium]
MTRSADTPATTGPGRSWTCSLPLHGVHPVRRVAFAVLAAALVAGGCSAGTGTAQPDQLRIAVAEDFGPLNILNQSEDPLTFLVYDRLVAPSPYAQDPQPWLATEVRNVDPKTWMISLREDVTWHDGEPLTAQDVAFTVSWFKEVPSGTYTHHITTVPHIAQVEVLDTYQVRLTCAYACPFLGTVTLAHVPIMPEHIWSGIEEPTRHTELPVGTGPYRLVSHEPGQGYRFEANPDYFAGEPLVETLLMPIIPNPTTTFTALRTGEIDAATQFLPPELVEQFRNADDIEVITTTPLQFPELRINYRRAPFDDPEFRRALSMAIDRRELNDTVWLGKGRVADRGYPHPDSPWTNPELRTTYQPQAARQLLDRLGFTDADGDGVREGPGGPLSYTIYVDGSVPVRVRATQLVAEQLREIGIGARAETIDTGALSNLLDSKEYDLYLDSIGAHGVADPTQFIMSHFSGYLWDLPEVPYPAFQALFGEWKAAETIEARAGVSWRMQELFNSRPTAIPLHYPSGELGYRPEAYDGWVESPGYGLVHKWSLLPREVAQGAGAILEPGR